MARRLHWAAGMQTKLLLVTAFIGGIAACGGDPEADDPRGRDSLDAGLTTSSDAGTTVADAGQPLDGGEALDAGPVLECEGEADLTMSNRISSLGGDYQIHGTIHLDREVPAGTRWILAFRDFETDGIDAANSFETAFVDAPTSTLTYRIENLGGRPIWVYAVVDLNDNRRLGAGDIGGYLTADPSTPVTDGADAPAVSFDNGSVCGADFALGAL